MQHALLPHCNVGGVGEVYESSEHLGADVAQRDLWGGTLSETAGEHGSEVRAAGGKNHFVHLIGDKRRCYCKQEEVLSFHPPCPLNQPIQGVTEAPPVASV